MKTERRKSRLATVGTDPGKPAGRPPDPASLLPPFPSEPDADALDFDSPPDDDLTLARPIPRIERMPEGIEVVEKPVGHAVAQWIVMVRCQCGRRWFEVEFIDTATCPRCGMFVVVELDGVPPNQ